MKPASLLCMDLHSEECYQILSISDNDWTHKAEAFFLVAQQMLLKCSLQQPQ